LPHEVGDREEAIVPGHRDTPIVVGLGELLWDVFPDSRRPGGAPANVAFHAQQLGCRGLVASRVGTDPPGEELCAYLHGKGLDTRLIQRDPLHPTGRVTVDVSRPERPHYTIHEEVAWDYVAADPDLLDAARAADAICFGTLAQRSPVSRATVRQVLAAAADECLIVYDVNLRQNYYQRDWIEASLERLSVLKLNHDEVAVLGPLLGIPDHDDAAFASAVQKRYGVRLVCVTRAERGCLLVGAGERAEARGSPVEVVDAVGAGDAFTAALIAAVLRDWPLESVAEFANCVGSLVTTRPGAMPDLRDEFQHLRAKFARRTSGTV
jgi:fructokinase